MIKQFNANSARLRRHQRMRNHLQGSQTRPRLNVFRSGQHIYAQIIDDSSGRTLAAASSLDESLRDYKPEPPAAASEQAAQESQASEQAAEAAPAAKGKAVRSEKAAKGGPAGKGSPAAKGAPAAKGRPPTQVKITLPQAVKGEKKTPVEALASIASNRKVATAREVGKLLARRAQSQGVARVVFDRGGYAYHGRVAALAEGAREVGLEF